MEVLKMLEYDYLENVKEDVKDYLEENPPEVKDFTEFIKCERINDNGDCEYFFEDLCDFKEELNNDLFIDDNVTGNASGSYTFNSNKAKDNIFKNGMETLKAAINEDFLTPESFTNYFLDESWESLDVTCRCFDLYTAIDEAVDEWAANYAENNQDYLKQLYEEC